MSKENNYLKKMSNGQHVALSHEIFDDVKSAEDLNKLDANGKPIFGHFSHVRDEKTKEKLNTELFEILEAYRKEQEADDEEEGEGAGTANTMTSLDSDKQV